MKMEIIGIAETDVLVRMNGTHIVKIPLIGISEEHELVANAASYRLGFVKGSIERAILYG
jgi:hypothetical protein